MLDTGSLPRFVGGISKSNAMLASDDVVQPPSEPQKKAGSGPDASNSCPGTSDAFPDINRQAVVQILPLSGASEPQYTAVKDDRYEEGWVIFRSVLDPNLIVVCPTSIEAKQPTPGRHACSTGGSPLLLTFFIIAFGGKDDIRVSRLSGQPRKEGHRKPL